MFEAEARWLRRALTAFPPERLSPVLNLGSSSAVVRKAIQPWIDSEVFCPLRSRGVAPQQGGMRQCPGVDIRADLTEAADVRRLGALGPKALLCCNLLEHVSEEVAAQQRLRAKRAEPANIGSIGQIGPDIDAW